MPKMRLDNLLVEKGLVESRSKASALILAGKVLVNDVAVDKVGTLVKEDASIRLKTSLKYVGRGGLKLEKALQEFEIKVTDKICLDVGASTGGFTDCLLQHGAKKVYAVDVGTNELHWKLEKDPRVVNLNKENFRHFDCQKILDPIDIAVMDVSFISVTLLIPKVLEIFELSEKHRDPRGGSVKLLFPTTPPARPEPLRRGEGPYSGATRACVRQRTDQPQAEAMRRKNSELARTPTGDVSQTLVILIKPQFELSPEEVGKGGIVRDEVLRQKAVKKIEAFCLEKGFQNIQTIPSPITGREGNQEFLLKAEWFLKKF